MNGKNVLKETLSEGVSWNSAVSFHVFQTSYPGTEIQTAKGGPNPVFPHYCGTSDSVPGRIQGRVTPGTAVGTPGHCPWAGMNISWHSGSTEGSTELQIALWTPFSLRIWEKKKPILQQRKLRQKKSLLDLPEHTWSRWPCWVGSCALDGCATLGSLHHLYLFPLFVAHLKVGDEEVCTKKFIAALITITKLKTNWQTIGKWLREKYGLFILWNV